MKHQNQFYPIVEKTGQLFPPEQHWWKSFESYQEVKHIHRLKYLECMACCHCVANVEGTYIGDPLDIEMFKATEWLIDESEETNHATEEIELVSFYPTSESEELKKAEESHQPFYKLGIIKRFDFSSNLQ